MSTTRKPDFRLKIRDTVTSHTGEVGGGWLNEDGHILIRLNPGTLLTYDTLKGKTLVLFPVVEGKKDP